MRTRAPGGTGPPPADCIAHGGRVDQADNQKRAKPHKLRSRYTAGAGKASERLCQAARARARRRLGKRSDERARERAADEARSEERAREPAAEACGE